MNSDVVYVVLIIMKNAEGKEIGTFADVAFRNENDALAHVLRLKNGDVLQDVEKIEDASFRVQCISLY